jgi:hypothetical protein
MFRPKNTNQRKKVSEAGLILDFAFAERVTLENFPNWLNGQPLSGLVDKARAKYPRRKPADSNAQQDHKLDSKSVGSVSLDGTHRVPDWPQGNLVRAMPYNPRCIPNPVPSTGPTGHLLGVVLGISVKTKVHHVEEFVDLVANGTHQTKLALVRLGGGSIWVDFVSKDNIDIDAAHIMGLIPVLKKRRK